jgi:hypothetical protein
VNEDETVLGVPLLRISLGPVGVKQHPGSGSWRDLQGCSRPRVGLFRVPAFARSLQPCGTGTAGIDGNRRACPHRCPITFDGRSRRSRQRPA